MKKYFPLITTLLFLSLFITTPVQAADHQWHLQLKDDNRIVEQIILTGQAGWAGGSEWKQSEKNGSRVLEREINNWEDYSRQTERLPVEGKVKNYIVFQKTTLSFDKKSSDTSFFRQLAEADSGKITIQLPGFFSADNAAEVTETTASWGMDRFKDVREGDILLTAYTFNGLNLAAVIFGLGFLVIGIYTAVKIRRINKLIEEKYSLDNINADADQEEETDDWK